MAVTIHVCSKILFSRGAVIRSPNAPPSSACRARHAAGTVQRPSRTCASNSCRKCFSVVSTGVAAASPNAQSVLPTMLLATLNSRSMSLHLAFAALDALQQLVQPVAAFAARRALAARLVAIEVQQVHRQPHHADRVVHDDEPGRAEQRTGLLHASKLAGVSRCCRAADGHRRSAGDDALNVRPSSMPPAYVAKISSRSVVSSTLRTRPAASRGR